MSAPRPFRAAAFALALGAAALFASPARADAAHVVGRGQTLFWIAKRYRTTPEAIRAANGLREGQLIHPGLSLIIPGAASRKDEAPKASAKGKERDGASSGAKSAGGAKKGKDDRAAKDAKDARGSKERDPKGAKKGKEAKDAKDAKKSDAPAGSYAARPKKPGFVKMVRGAEKLGAQVLTKGQLNRASLAGLTKILRHVASDSKKSVDPRLAYLIGLVSDHFGGRTIHVVSGYRPFSKKQYTPHSNHNLARAIDFAIEGVPNTVVRDYCRTLRDAGVGYYPNSTFVHLDVRAGKAYWIDYSKPGEPPKYQNGGKGTVDESARDVETGEQPGSSDTQGGAKQPSETKNEKSDDAGEKPASGATPGISGPTPSKPGSPTPAKGKSDDPYL